MKKQRAFTLIELMITLGVAVILFAFAAPAFQELRKNNRLTAAANEFLASANLARSEAIKRGRVATLCASTTTMAATPVCSNGNDWTVGWLVWVDLNGSGGGQPEAGEVLRVYTPEPNSNITITAGAQSAFIYSTTGTVNVVDDIFICDDRASELGRRIQNNITGRIGVIDKSYGC